MITDHRISDADLCGWGVEFHTTLFGNWIVLTL